MRAVWTDLPPGVALYAVAERASRLDAIVDRWWTRWRQLVRHPPEAAGALRRRPPSGVVHAVTRPDDFVIGAALFGAYSLGTTYGRERRWGADAARVGERAGAPTPSSHRDQRGPAALRPPGRRADGLAASHSVHRRFARSMAARRTAAGGDGQPGLAVPRGLARTPSRRLCGPRRHEYHAGLRCHATPLPGCGRAHDCRAQRLTIPTRSPGPILRRRWPATGTSLSSRTPGRSISIAIRRRCFVPLRASSKTSH